MPIAKGVHKVLYFRKLGEAANAAKLVFQTEHAKSYKRDREATPTKDGNVSGSGALEDEVSISALQSTDDPTYTMLEDSIVEDYPVEMWEVDLAKRKVFNEGGKEVIKFAAEYRQGYITEWEATSSAEDDPEVEGTFLTEGVRQKGFVTLPEGDMETLAYVFHDLLPTDPADDGLAKPPENDDTP
ncbi:phage major tail protein, TP901-1 family [Virgibacillus pantothenticus]|uniref:phage major tail protein, TP901-1 family n=1 Tax=Virgibacillus pantothenticus TaxID=1473 RepID=UPI0009864BE2|nr:phage major tail protein, TP901-1 family [Virgibacillus pantothenticus]MBU8567587.1 phage major tail protein, TP901-1 family [Virgibacillus pantothenticus]MBU8601375.1 phage major tail protein, TP901-1 family [Virgibacillus pantothenticus]MBU8636192.1 phage major tail protein, TP901-1 family [Virgibacillus pantothenticus]MBU8643712.1 phage major tail protein, TP901-1 family [Virgibacillus pantothenticus]MBU8648032.1 phage major tail protein, TP901-1 family [Virgibacillus pantothenticus]